MDSLPRERAGGHVSYFGQRHVHTHLHCIEGRGTGGVLVIQFRRTQLGYGGRDLFSTSLGHHGRDHLSTLEIGADLADGAFLGEQGT